MSSNQLPPYKKPIIFYLIGIGLSIAILIIMPVLYIVTGWSIDIIPIMVIAMTTGSGIVLPIILIIINIIAVFIHDKVSINFEYLPLIFGLLNAILSGIIILITFFLGISAFFSAFFPVDHIPYFGYFIVLGILELLIAVVLVGSLVYGIKIVKWE
ncbi:MAG: hypothetical protein ACTSPY_14175 [Candidatus Helarchaeota archaeon]